MDIDYSNQFKRKRHLFQTSNNKKKKFNDIFGNTNNLFQTNNLETRINNLENRVNHIESYIKTCSNTVHYGIQCNNCNENNIKGIRYKCGHCLQYNVCEKCEKYLDTIHDSNHLFVRIHNPNLAYLVGN